MIFEACLRCLDWAICSSKVYKKAIPFLYFQIPSSTASSPQAIASTTAFPIQLQTLVLLTSIHSFSLPNNHHAILYHHRCCHHGFHCDRRTMVPHWWRRLRPKPRGSFRRSLHHRTPKPSPSPTFRPGWQCKHLSVFSYMHNSIT